MNQDEKINNVASATMGATVGAGVAYGLPLAANFVGFGVNGISAGSIAAGCMSYAAKKSGGRILSGSLVAVMQSFGAIGLPGASVAGLMTAGAALGLAYQRFDRAKKWVIAIIDGSGKLNTTLFNTEKYASESYSKSPHPRIMYDPDRVEVLTDGLESQLVAIRRTLIKFEAVGKPVWYNVVMKIDGKIEVSSFEDKQDGELRYTTWDGPKILYNIDHEEVRWIGSPRDLNKIREYIIKNGFT
ncbi:hypothetical protein ABG067_006367 [Albugo candida]